MPNDEPKILNRRDAAEAYFQLNHPTDGRDPAELQDALIKAMAARFMEYRDQLNASRPTTKRRSR